MFCKIINVFTLTYDQFNASLLIFIFNGSVQMLQNTGLFYEIIYTITKQFKINIKMAEIKAQQTLTTVCKAVRSKKEKWR